MPFTVRWRLAIAPFNSEHFFLILRISTEKSLNYKTSTCESSTTCRDGSGGEGGGFMGALNILYQLAVLG